MTSAPSPRSATVLAVIFFLVGCLGEGPPSQEEVELPASAGPRAFSNPIIVAPAASEAFVATDPEGMTVLTCTHGGFSRWSPSFASLDGGHSWRTFEPGPVPGGDCEVEMGPDGAWYFVSSTVASASVASTRNQGQSWVVSYLSGLPTNGMVDRPWLLATESMLLLTYVPTRAQPGMVGATRSWDGGATWELPRTITSFDPAQEGIRSRKPWLDPDGSIRVPWEKFHVPDQTTGDFLTSTLGISYSQDGGTTWREQVVRRIRVPVSLDFGAAGAADGTLYFTYQTPHSGGNPLMVIHSLDGGSSWSEQTILQPDPRPTPGGARLYMRGGTVGSWVDVAWEAPEPEGGSSGESSLYYTRLDARADEPLVQQLLRVADASGAEYVALAHDGEGRALLVQPAFGELRLFRQS